MKAMDEDVKWMKPTHPLSTISPNLRAPFRTTTFTSYILIAFSMHTLEENITSPGMYTMYAHASNNTPSYNHISSYMV